MKKLLLFLLICLASCSEDCPECDAGYRIINIYGKRKHEKNGWDLASIGGSFPSGDIRKLNLSFWIDQKESVETSRILIVNAVQEFLVLINQDTKIRPHLNHYPFTPKDLSFALGFHYKFGGFITDGYVSDVSLSQGKLYYYYFDKQDRLLKDLHEESFEEAQKIVQQTESPTALIP